LVENIDAAPCVSRWVAPVGASRGPLGVTNFVRYRRNYLPRLLTGFMVCMKRHKRSLGWSHSLALIAHTAHLLDDIAKAAAVDEGPIGQIPEK
jgi:hypothetical protein